MSKSTNTLYGLQKVGIITGKNSYSDQDKTSESDKLVDGDFETYYSSDTDICYVGWDYGENYKA